MNGRPPLGVVIQKSFVVENEMGPLGSIVRTVGDVAEAQVSLVPDRAAGAHRLPRSLGRVIPWPVRRGGVLCPGNGVPDVPDNDGYSTPDCDDIPDDCYRCPDSDDDDATADDDATDPTPDYLLGLGGLARRRRK